VGSSLLAHADAIDIGVEREGFGVQRNTTGEENEYSKDIENE
jgi:hypothetical protein